MWRASHCSVELARMEVVLLEGAWEWFDDGWRRGDFGTVGDCREELRGRRKGVDIDGGLGRLALLKSVC